jgi:hypothetical protein
VAVWIRTSAKVDFATLYSCLRVLCQILSNRGSGSNQALTTYSLKV